MTRSIRDINNTPPPNNPGVLCKIVQKYDIKRKVFAIGLKRPKTKIPRKSAGFLGGDTGTRTLDPMIKSHLLYQLSYVPKTELE